MPDLQFQVTGVHADALGLTPLLQFVTRIENAVPEEKIQAVMLHAQIQIRAAQRSYSAGEKEQLRELFGEPHRWGETLRTRLWAHADVTVPSFAGSTEVRLSVPCTYDLNMSGAKYFYALESGEVDLLFLFSGTVFYAKDGGPLQVQQISWDRECTFRLPVRTWRELMDQHYPNSAWLYLQRDVFDRFYAHKRRNGFATWEQAMNDLLNARGPEAVAT